MVRVILMIRFGAAHPVNGYSCLCDSATKIGVLAAIADKRFIKAA